MKHLHPPPPDQAIVDDYFRLQNKKDMQHACWLYGMLATYGLKPKELKGFSWNKDNTITIKSKRKTITPMHPQWIILFQLKEKQPSKFESCFNSIEGKLKDLIKTKRVSLNLADLQLAYCIRKKFYLQKAEDQQRESLFSSVLYAHS